MNLENEVDIGEALIAQEASTGVSVFKLVRNSPEELVQRSLSNEEKIHSGRNSLSTGYVDTLRK